MSTKTTYHLIALPFFDDTIIDHGEVPTISNSVSMAVLNKICNIEQQLVIEANERLTLKGLPLLDYTVNISNIYCVEIQQLIERWSKINDPQYNTFVRYLTQKFDEKKLVGIFGLTCNESDTYLVVQQ